MIRLEYNRQIAELVNPTFITAVVELLDLPYDQIEWVDIDVTDVAFILVVSVTYTPGVDTSPFLGQSSVENAAMIQKNIRVSIPLSKLFDPVDEIKEYLRQPSKATEPSKQIAMPSLTKEQIQQMLLCQHLTPGTKQ